jgi:hypothetical protein
MTRVSDRPSSNGSGHDVRPEELLGRLVAFRGLIGHCQQLWVGESAHVVIVTQEGALLKVPKSEWGEIEVLS